MGTFITDLFTESDRARNIEQMSAQLFSSKPIASTVEGAYAKTCLTDVISLLFSGYSIIETWQLSSEIDAVQENYIISYQP